MFVIATFVASDICCFSRWTFVGLLVCCCNICHCNICRIRYVSLQPLDICWFVIAMFVIAMFVASDLCHFSRWMFVGLSFQHLLHLICVDSAVGCLSVCHSGVCRIWYLLEVCWFVIANFVIAMFVASDMCRFSRWMFVGLLLQCLSMQRLLHPICVASAIKRLPVCCIWYVLLQPLDICKFVIPTCVASDICHSGVGHLLVCYCNVCRIRYVLLQLLNVCWFVIPTFVASHMCCFSHWTFVGLSFRRLWV